MSSDNISDRLNSLKKHIIKTESKTGGTPVPGRYTRLAEELGGELVTRAEGTYCLVKKFYPEGTVLGDVRLEAAGQELDFSRSAFTVREETGEVAVSELLFFDIETTGLGGTGRYWYSN